MSITRRALGLSVGAAAVAGVAGKAVAGAAGSGPTQAVFDPTPFVNPALRKFVAPLLRMTGSPLTGETLAQRRKGPLGRPPLATPALSQQTIPGPPGAPAVRLYLCNFRPDEPPRPAILHIHGGGFVMGSPLSSIRAAQEAALALDCAIVSVDYRLAPETRFPGALEDNYAALKWLHANAARLGVDASRIAVMGESAGGGHAAMLAIAARDRGEIALAYQALIYPMLDDRTGSARKPPPYQGALIWTPENNRFGWSALLGVAAGAARVPYGSVPARVESLRGLPPTFIGVGSIDLFVDEDLEYARRLVDAGIPVTVNVVPGAFHGFDGLPGSLLAKPFQTALFNAMREAFGTAS